MAQHSQPLDLEEAQKRLADAADLTLATEAIPLSGALGRILAAPISAPTDMPPFPASAMDGYALRRADLKPNMSFKVIGTSKAGHPYDGDIESGEAVRIFTGAVVPASADQVVLQEEVQDSDEHSVTFVDHLPTESYVRPVAHDVSRGTQIASAGDRITPFLLGALTSYGVAQVEVYEALKIGVFSTGDELVDAGVELKTGQIYDSNRATVLALLKDSSLAVTDLGRLPDQKEVTEQMLAEASQSFHVLITSGGVSVGDADFVTGTIAELGQLEFWRLNLKPGKPMAVGRIGDCTIFGLPGNPVSTVITLLMVAKPTLFAMLGARQTKPLKLTAKLLDGLSHSPGRMEYQRGWLVHDDNELVVKSTGDQSSNRLSGLAQANCLIEVPKESGDLTSGDFVAVIPFRGLLA